MKKLLLLTLAFVFVGMAKAEDGHKLWLRQTPVNKAVVMLRYQDALPALR